MVCVRNWKRVSEWYREFLRLRWNQVEPFRRRRLRSRGNCRTSICGEWLFTFLTIMTHGWRSNGYVTLLPRSHSKTYLTLQFCSLVGYPGTQCYANTFDGLFYDRWCNSFGQKPERNYCGFQDFCLSFKVMCNSLFGNRWNWHPIMLWIRKLNHQKRQLSLFFSDWYELTGEWYREPCLKLVARYSKTREHHCGFDFMDERVERCAKVYWFPTAV